MINQPCSNSNSVPGNLWSLMFLAFGKHKEAFLRFPQLTTPVGLKRIKKND